MHDDVVDLGALEEALYTWGFDCIMKYNHFVMFVDRDHPERRIQLFYDEAEIVVVRWDDFETSCEYGGVDAEAFRQHFDAMQ